MTCMPADCQSGHPGLALKSASPADCPSLGYWASRPRLATPEPWGLASRVRANPCAGSGHSCYPHGSCCHVAGSPATLGESLGSGTSTGRTQRARLRPRHIHRSIILYKAGRAGQLPSPFGRRQVRQARDALPGLPAGKERAGRASFAHRARRFPTLSAVTWG
ncbi:hypothetical protein L7E55_07510 [Pelotomaculum isophthalicicum JI]|uniref:Uncharacterized protein n=1 Tax=Pelotomaculum isophthalicicum JI TaxID=947010 RepID=A0A9X4H294_9FIRM|nr:hypothetical protein [Pelotomaculum isophthalicicum]MDF9408206.1 hypothetical protein [Pelotomaculum isophthalicicum JI]